MPRKVKCAKRARASRRAVNSTDAHPRLARAMPPNLPLVNQLPNAVHNLSMDFNLS